MKKLFVSILLLVPIILNGCYGVGGSLASQGKRSAVYDAARLASVNRIFIPPVMIVVDEKSYTLSKPLADTVWRDVDSEKVVWPIPSDSVWKTAEAIGDKDSSGMDKLAQQLHADAYLKVAITYAHSSGPLKEPSAWCYLVLRDAKSQKNLLECEFDTYLEKDYWLGPAKIEQVTRDAISGAVKKFGKAVRENRHS